MTTLNATTKKGQSFINRYNNSLMYNIYDAYIRPSGAKIRIYSYWAQEAKKDKIGDFKIIAASCHYFTVAWPTADGLRVETAGNSYLIK